MKLALLLLLLATSIARGDTVQYRSAQLQLPDDGWTVSFESGYLLLAAESGGAIIEVYNFSKVPAADRAALTKLVDDRKETEDVAITALSSNHEQHGLHGIAFGGTAKIRGTVVELTAVGLALPKRAVVAVAFAMKPTDARRREIAAILASAQAAP